jgi:putative phage-type endonuclease
MQIIKDIEQKSPEWFAMRDLKLTASQALAIGNSGKGLESLCRKLVAQHFNPTPDEERYTNADIERGNELESQARNIFEFKNDLEVEQVCFVIHSDFVGCSPDGLTSDGGLIEIKCYNDENYLEYLDEGKIDTKYEWQMQMQMLICEKPFCYFVVYNPNFPKNSIQITKVYADKEKQDKLIIGFEKGIELIKKYLTLIGE